MNSKERVLKTINHEVPDRPPLDLGTSNCTTMTRAAYARLLRHLGKEHLLDSTRLMQENFQVVFIHDEILDLLEIDTRNLCPQPTFQKTVIDETAYLNPFGTRLEKPQGSYFYSMVGFPLKEKEYEEIRDYPWPDPRKSLEVTGLRERGRRLHEEGRYALMADVIDAGIFELCWFVRGFEDFLMDLLLNPKIAHFLLDTMLNYQLRRYETFLGEVGEYLDLVFCGDDLASMDSTYMPPEVYRDVIKPYQKRLFSSLKTWAPKAKLIYHCCGNVTPILDDLIEIGMDILNPVQVNARDMDSAALKRKYGSRIGFWGGIDTSRVLPHGTPREVREEVRKRVREMGPEGYVPLAVHDIQPDVPPENVIAMYEEIRKIRF